MDSNESGSVPILEWLSSEHGRATLAFEAEWNTACERLKQRERYALNPALHIDALFLTTRLHAVLRDAGYVSIPMLEKMPDYLLMELRGVGRIGLEEVREKIQDWREAEDKHRFVQGLYQRKLGQDALKRKRAEEARRAWLEREAEEERRRAKLEEEDRKYLESRRWPSGEEMAEQTPESEGERTIDWDGREIRLKYIQYGETNIGRCMIVLPQLSLSAVGDSEEGAWHAAMSVAIYRLEELDRSGVLSKTLETINALPGETDTRVTSSA